MTGTLSETGRALVHGRSVVGLNTHATGFHAADTPEGALKHVEATAETTSP